MKEKKVSRWQALFDWLHDIATMLKTNGLAEERHYNILKAQLDLVLNDNVYLREAIEKLTKAQVIRARGNAEDHDSQYVEYKLLRGEIDSLHKEVRALQTDLGKLGNELRSRLPYPWYYPYWCTSYSNGVAYTSQPEVSWGYCDSSTAVQGGAAPVEPGVDKFNIPSDVCSYTTANGGNIE